MASLQWADLPHQVRLPYVEQGDPSGVPVLFLHGFADSWRSFELVLEHLPTWVHAIALTQRGHGDASRPAAGYSIRDLAADVDAFLDALALQAAVLVGHSMGSAVALRFAIDHPQRTLGLVLEGASPSLRATPAAREHWDAVLAQLIDPINPVFVRQLVESAVVQPVPKAFLEAMIRENTKPSVQVWQAVFASRWRLEGEYAGELDRIAVPTLIVWGDRDARYPRREQEALRAALKGSRLVIYVGAGHLLHWEEPGRFAADVAGFVGRLPR